MDTKKEIWINLEYYGLLPYYYVSNYGRVMSLYGGNKKILKSHTGKDGYLKINLFTNEHKSKCLYIAKLTMIAFGMYDQNKIIRFIDGNRRNCNISNMLMIEPRTTRKISTILATYFCRGMTFKECINQNTHTIQEWQKYFEKIGIKSYTCLQIDEHIKKQKTFRKYSGGYMAYTSDKRKCLNCFEKINNHIKDLNNEKWVCLDILGYKPIYYVSNYGRVKSLYDGKEKIKVLRINKDGYLDVSIRDKFGKEKRIAVHLLVVKAFGIYEYGKVVDHIDADRQNNHISNLRMLTQAENIKHGVELGHYTKEWRKKNNASKYI